MSEPGARAVVTGSTRGLGRAFTDALVETGASVVVNGTTPDGVDRVLADMRARGADVRGVVGSVADYEVCERLISTCVDEFGGIDLLVNNAGVTRDRSLMKMSVEEFDEVIAVHLRGTWACGSIAARAMREQGGAIVNIASGSGLFGMFGQANYAAAKAGIVGLSRVMHLELSRFGIRTNVLAPVAQTDMTEVFMTGAVGHTEEFPPPADVAPVVAFLGSDAARHVSGQVISFDGSRLSVWSHPKATSTAIGARWTTELFAQALAPSMMEEFHPDRWGSGTTT